MTGTGLARLALLVAGLTAVASCTSAAPGGTEPKGTGTSAALATGGTFAIAGSEIHSFDPYSDFDAAFIAPFAYDSLVNVDARGEVVSGLARSWTATTTRAVFTLRSGITCSDGSALTASDVANAINQAKDPKNNFGPPQQILPTVPFTVTGDDKTGVVTVTMSSPFSFITRSIGILPIVCPRGLANLKSLDHATDGTGPYTLTSYKAGGPDTMTRRPGYAWGPDGAKTSVPGQPGKLVLEDIPSSSTAANLLLTGGINAAIVSGADTARLDAEHLYKVDISTVLGLTSFNQRPGRILADPKLRTALVEAVNRTKAGEVAVGGGKVDLAGDVKARGTACYGNAAANLPAYDPGAARRLLDSDGWKTGPGGTREKNGKPLHLTLITPPDQAATLPATSEFMAQEWKAIGVDTKVVTVTENALVADLYQTGNWDVFVNATPNEPLPSQLVPFLAGPVPPKGVNFAGISNAAYVRLTSKALHLAGDASCPVWLQAVGTLFKAADVLVIANGATPYYGYKATFALGNNFNLMPTTIRLYK
ncbi:MAG TPA: ABC transporter substrate-binding protein [Streptosporangiaceae bacterium]|nr:ABC transporter substrate-binding protein [Streptosporangiaceae bacterium]